MYSARSSEETMIAELFGFLEAISHVAWTPSMSGRWMSMRMTSGLSSLARRSLLARRRDTDHRHVRLRVDQVAHHARRQVAVLYDQDAQRLVGHRLPLSHRCRVHCLR